LKIWVSGIWLDCSINELNLNDATVHEITPERIQSNARYIVVVEKDGIYQRLASDPIFCSQLGLILICGCGIPDNYTRIFLSTLQKSLPGATVVGVFDYNPGGLQVLLTYKCGSAGLGLESFRYAVNVHWLSLRSNDLLQLSLPQQYYQPMSKHDNTTLKSLYARELVQSDCLYKTEIDKMKELQGKIELEAIEHYYGYGFFANFITKKIITKSWI